MKASWFRFRLRSLMLLVLVAALGLGLAALVARSRRFQRIAVEHARAAQSAADVAWGYNRFGRRPGDGNDQIAARHGAAYSHHHELAAKYRRASSRPWRPLAADPLEPATP